MAEAQTQPTRSTPGRGIGHVHLKVADIDRALEFYCGVLGFELTQRWATRRRSSPPAAITTTSASTPGSRRAAARRRRGPRASFTSRSSTRPGATLADALRRVRDAGIPLDGASDHGVSEALYLRDPDENGVELYWDRPRGRVAARPRRSRTGGDVHRAARPRRPARRARLTLSRAAPPLRAVLAAELLQADAGFGDLRRRLVASPASARSRADSSESSKSSAISSGVTRESSSISAAFSSSTCCWAAASSSSVGTRRRRRAR